MANPPSDFLDVDEIEPQPRMQRSRSGGYADHLEEQSRRDRNHREREMKRYHESRYGASLASRQRSAANRLSVPIFETNTRRNRSTSEAERRRDESASPAYSVQEVRPGSRRRSDYGLPSEALIASQFPPGLQRSDTRGKHHTKKPSIKVQIHQDKPPASRAVTTSAPSTKRSSPNISPRSPGAQPQLSYQYTTLQQKLSQIAMICGPYLKVEAANPSDLTFSKINEIVRGYAFDLQVWASLINVQNMARIDSRKREVVEAASRNLDRLIERTKELSEACKSAKPRDLKFEGLDEMDEEDMFDDYAESENGYVKHHPFPPILHLMNWSHA